jgi:Activator of Hsp90 ATPase homolog 1-like protein
MSQATVASPTSLVISRTYPASVDRVFKAWTDANQLGQWFAPTDDYTTKANVDLRVGHEYRIAITHKGGNVHTILGTPQARLHLALGRWPGIRHPRHRRLHPGGKRHQRHHHPRAVHHHRGPRQAQRRLERMPQPLGARSHNSRTVAPQNRLPAAKLRPIQEKSWQIRSST